MFLSSSFHSKRWQSPVDRLRQMLRFRPTLGADTSTDSPGSRGSVMAADKASVTKEAVGLQKDHSDHEHHLPVDVVN